MFSKLFLLFLTTLTLFSYPTTSQTIKEKKIYPMGEKIYNIRCKTIDPLNFNSYSDMQKSILSENLCKNLNEKHFEALSLYLWDIKRVNKHEKVYDKLTVTKDDKCPICGMFLYKYPTWVSRINYDEKSFSFDGIKDMMKFYFDNREGITDILVQDYYTQKTINAKSAFFALGSDVYGPMGNEIIAFKDIKSAKRFMLDHRAKKVLTFDVIDAKIVYKLDE